MCTQKCGFLPKVWIHRLRRDLHAVSVFRLRTTAALNLFFFGRGAWTDHTFIHPNLTNCLKNLESRPGMCLWLLRVVPECYFLISIHLRKHKCMLKPSALSKIILRPFGNHGYLTRVELCHRPQTSEERNVRYCKCNVSLCYIIT